MFSNASSKRLLVVASFVALAAALPAGAGPQADPAAAKDQKPDYPPFDTVIDGFTKVVSTIDGSAPLYELYKNEKTAKLLAVIPADHETQLIMIACTVSGGDPQAGVMGPTHYAKWRKIRKQLVLVEPNLLVRTEGDTQAKDSIKQLYTDRVIVATPIVSMAPGGKPVIDIGSLCTTQASKFFGPSVWGAYGPSLGKLNTSLSSLTKAKAFPDNIIFEYEAPRPDGRLIRLTYSFGKLQGTPGYTPRKADPRVDYFYNWHHDYARAANRDVTDRYIIRWNLEKADPKLKMSPPKEPIIWYIEHTTPVRFRRYVREGILMWNQAFEEIGIVNAVEVYQQDAGTGAHMEKDPEDARYNFFRWNASDQGYAIGPSRTNPLTGEILDADVVWHQGLTRALRNMLESLSEDLVDETFSPETLAWLDEHPDWDPRVRLATPARREQMLRRRAIAAERAVTEDLYGPQHPWTHSINDPTNTACRMGRMLSLEFALVDAAMVAGVLDTDGEELLDGLPEQYMGPMIRYISAHEVGHCMGLQHNMAASSIRTLKEINTEGYDGPIVGSVMDYVAVNLNHELGEVQGPFAPPALGPYDLWAIACGYGPEEGLDEVLARVGEPDLVFVSQLAMGVGSDPRNMTWDLGANNLNFAEYRAQDAEDVFTLAEVVKTVTDSIWSECAEPSSGRFSARAPMVSSFRRNLQREHVGRLVDLALLPDVPSPALRTISSMATQELRRIDTFAAAALKSSPDPYTDAHLADIRRRIRKTLDAAYVITP